MIEKFRLCLKIVLPTALHYCELDVGTEELSFGETPCFSD